MPGIREDQQRGMIKGAQQEMTVGSGAGIVYPLLIAASFSFFRKEKAMPAWSGSNDKG